jgi:hypothetical protein
MRIGLAVLDVDQRRAVVLLTNTVISPSVDFTLRTCAVTNRRLLNSR